MEQTPLVVLLKELTVYRDCDGAIDHIMKNYTDLAAHCKVTQDDRGRLSASAPSHIACAIAMIVCGKVTKLCCRHVLAVEVSDTEVDCRSAGHFWSCG